MIKIKLKKLEVEYIGWGEDYTCVVGYGRENKNEQNKNGVCSFTQKMNGKWVKGSHDWIISLKVKYVLEELKVQKSPVLCAKLLLLFQPFCIQGEFFYQYGLDLSFDLFWTTYHNFIIFILVYKVHHLFTFLLKHQLHSFFWYLQPFLLHFLHILPRYWLINYQNTLSYQLFEQRIINIGFFCCSAWMEQDNLPFSFSFSCFMQNAQEWSNACSQTDQNQIVF